MTASRSIFRSVLTIRCSDGATSDGTFIRRNSVYVVNVTLKRLGSGSDNPEVPADPASLTVTVEPQEWATDLIQNVEW